MNKRTTTRTLIALLFALLPACSSRAGGSGAGGSSGAAGAAGAATGGSGGATQDPTCAKACSIIGPCDPTTDVGKCEAQCAKELAGQGYLIPEIAKPFFQVIAEAAPTTDCSSEPLAWDQWRLHPDVIDQLAAQNVMMQCRDEFNQCLGPTVTQDGFRYNCFRQYYRYNVDIRAKLSPCFAMQCSPTQPYKCIDQNQPKGRPWVGETPQ